MRRMGLLTTVVLLGGCGLQDANTPIPQPDTPVFGRIASIREIAEEPGVHEVDVRSGLPETLRAIMQAEGRAIPELEKDLTTRVRITPDTVCIVDLRATDLDAFRVGHEVAVIPSPGTSAMVGTKLLLTSAAELYLFSSYQVRFLPRSLATVPAELSDRRDPTAINSSGMERTPVPVGDGRVVYFSAGLLRQIQPDAEPRGAVRKGMRGEDDELMPWAVGGYRPYRTALGIDGWSAPEPIAFPGLEPGDSARVTWVQADEAECLVTVQRADGDTALFAASRDNPGSPWGELTPVERAVGEEVGDAQRFGRDGGSLVWTVFDTNGSDLWLAMPEGEGQPLEPRINTLGAEWSPRVGPGTTLYFCRGERQLLFAGGVIQEVRLTGSQRRPFLEATPTSDGEWLFFQLPRFTPGEPDGDLAVARREGSGWGAPVLLDTWRP